MDKLPGDGRRTRHVFDYIVDFMETYGYVPSRREIALGTGIVSTGVVNYHIKALIELGYLSQPRPYALVVVGMEMRYYGDRP